MIEVTFSNMSDGHLLIAFTDIYKNNRDTNNHIIQACMNELVERGLSEELSIIMNGSTQS